MGDYTPPFAGYTLEDEEEKERRRRQQQGIEDLGTYGQLGGLLRETPEPSRRPQLTSLLPRRNPQTARAWQSAEDTALERSGYGSDKPYGVGEGLRDFAPVAIAGLLDVLINKGRGLGHIAGAAGQSAMSERERRDKQADIAGKFALNARQQREAGDELGVNAENARLRGEELGLGYDRLDLEKQKLLGQGADPVLNELRKAQTSLAWAQGNNAWLGRSDSYMTANEQAINADRDATRQLAEQKAAQAVKDRAEGRQIEKDKAAQTAADRKEARRLRIAVTNQTGLAAHERARETAGEHDRHATETFSEQNKISRDLANNIMRAEAMLQKYPGDLPGEGRFDSRIDPSLTLGEERRADAIAMRQAKEKLASSYRYLKTGAAAAMSEAEELRINNALQPGATEQALRIGIKTLADLTRAELRTRAAASPANARRALQAGGLADWVGGWGPDSEEKPYPDYVPLPTPPEDEEPPTAAQPAAATTPLTAGPTAAAGAPLRDPQLQSASAQPSAAPRTTTSAAGVDTTGVEAYSKLTAAQRQALADKSRREMRESEKGVNYDKNHMSNEQYDALLGETQRKGGDVPSLTVFQPGAGKESYWVKSKDGKRVIELLLTAREAAKLGSRATKKE